MRLVVTVESESMSERRAYFCDHPEHEKSLMPYRVFLLPSDPDVVPRCKEHPQRKMVRQKNEEYRKNGLFNPKV